MHTFLAEVKAYAAMFFMIMAASLSAVAVFHLATAPTVVTDDMAEFDCLVDGNQVCRIGGHLVVNLDDMPSDPYGRCEWLLSVPDRLPDGVTFAAPDMCGETVGVNR